jgi:Damage-control phosphatase ARMT1-like domain
VSNRVLRRHLLASITISSFETVIKRWPVILTNIIDIIYRTNHGFQVSSIPQSVEMEQRVAEGKVIIEKISKLKYDMGRDKPLEYVYLADNIHYSTDKRYLEINSK